MLSLVDLSIVKFGWLRFIGRGHSALKKQPVFPQHLGGRKLKGSHPK